MLRVGGRAGDGGLPAGHGEPDVSTPPQCETFSRWGPGPTRWGRARTCGLERRREGKRFPSWAGTSYSWAHRDSGVWGQLTSDVHLPATCHTNPTCSAGKQQVSLE